MRLREDRTAAQQLAQPRHHARQVQLAALIKDARREIGTGVHMLLPDAELGQQALGLFERAGIELGFDLGVQRMMKRGRLVGRVAGFLVLGEEAQRLAAQRKPTPWLCALGA